MIVNNVNKIDKAGINMLLMIHLACSIVICSFIDRLLTVTVAIWYSTIGTVCIV